MPAHKKEIDDTLRIKEQILLNGITREFTELEEIRNLRASIRGDDELPEKLVRPKAL